MEEAVDDGEQVLNEQIQRMNNREAGYSCILTKEGKSRNAEQRGSNFKQNSNHLRLGRS